MLAFAGDKSGATLAANDVADVVVGDGVPTHVNSSMHSMQVDQATNDKVVEEVPEEGSGKGDVSGVKAARRTYKKKPRPANAGGDSPSAVTGDGRKRSIVGVPTRGPGSQQVNTACFLVPDDDARDNTVTHDLSWFRLWGRTSSKGGVRGHCIILHPMCL